MSELNGQLTLWDDPVLAPVHPLSQEAPITCESCGRTVDPYSHFLGHGLIPDDRYGDCQARKTRRHHVTSSARTISTRGVWPGRTKPARWKQKASWNELAAAITKAKEARIDDRWITGCVLGELACGGLVFDQAIYRATAA